jgi:hypothetical protein
VVRRAGWLTATAAIMIAAADLLIGRLIQPGSARVAAGSVGALLAPLKAVQTAVVILIPLLIGPTVIRVLAHVGPTPMPVPAARATVAGTAAGICCTGIGVIAGTATWLGSMIAGDPTSYPPTGAATWVIAAMLAAGAVAAAAAARDLAQARSWWSVLFAAQATLPDANRPDLLDDLSTLLARLLPGSATARTGAWVNRRLDDWTWSPRRHRAGFVLAAGCVVGLMLTGWRAAASEPWSGPLALPAFAAAATALVTAALGAGVAWLGLLRPQAPGQLTACCPPAAPRTASAVLDGHCSKAAGRRDRHPGPAGASDGESDRPGRA